MADIVSGSESDSRRSGRVAPGGPPRTVTPAWSNAEESAPESESGGGGKRGKHGGHRRKGHKQAVVRFSDGEVDDEEEDDLVISRQFQARPAPFKGAKFKRPPRHASINVVEEQAFGGGNGGGGPASGTGNGSWDSDSSAEEITPVARSKNTSAGPTNRSSVPEVAPEGQLTHVPVEVRQQLEEAEEQEDTCICGGEPLFDCTGCNMQGYCSSKCQREHWPQHSKVCGGWPGAVDPEEEQKQVELEQQQGDTGAGAAGGDGAGNSLAQASPRKRGVMVGNKEGEEDEDSDVEVERAHQAMIEAMGSRNERWSGSPNDDDQDDFASTINALLNIYEKEAHDKPGAKTTTSPTVKASSPKREDAQPQQATAGKQKEREKDAVNTAATPPGPRQINIVSEPKPRRKQSAQQAEDDGAEGRRKSLLDASSKEGLESWWAEAKAGTAEEASPTKDLASSLSIATTGPSLGLAGTTSLGLARPLSASGSRPQTAAAEEEDEEEEEDEAARKKREQEGEVFGTVRRAEWPSSASSSRPGSATRHRVLDDEKERDVGEITDISELSDATELSDTGSESSVGGGGRSGRKKKRGWYKQVTPVITSINDTHVGKRVEVQEYGQGVLRYFGPANFGRRAGAWLGIELDAPDGKNNGTVDGVTYFECPDKHGIFISLRSAKASLVPEPRTSRSSRRSKSAWSTGGTGSISVNRKLPQAPGQGTPVTEIEPAPAQTSTAAQMTLSQPRRIAVQPTQQKQTPKQQTNDDSDDGAQHVGAVLGLPKIIGPAAQRISVAAADDKNRATFADDDDDDDDNDNAQRMDAELQRTLRATRAAADPGADDDDDDAQDRIEYDEIEPANRSKPSSKQPQKKKKPNHPLHRAARSGKRKEIVHLLATGEYDIDCLDEHGRTPLMHAVHYGKLDSTDLLIRQGADVNFQEERDGSTALHDAAYQGSHLMVMLLLEAGADPNRRDYDGRLPLHWATGNPSPECIAVLVQKVPDADVNATDAAEMTPAMWAAYHNKPRNLRKLLKYGADLEEKDMEGKTAMHWGVSDDVSCLKEMLNYDRTFFKDSTGRTVAHIAAEKNCPRALDLCIHLRSDCILDLDHNMRTPLHWAAACGAVDCVKLLLGHGADPQCADKRDATPRDYVQAKRLTWKLDVDQARDLDECSRLLLRRANIQQLGGGGGGTRMSWDAESTADTVSIASEADLQQQRMRAKLASARRQNQPSEDGDDVGGFDDAAPHASNDTGPKPGQEELEKIMVGGFLDKLSDGGTGVARKKFFWVSLKTGELLWANSEAERNIKRVTTRILDVKSGPSSRVRRRPDFAANPSLKLAFEVSTDAKHLDLIAASEEEVAMWVEGLRALLSSRAVTVHRPSASGGMSSSPRGVPGSSSSSAASSPTRASGPSTRVPAALSPVKSRVPASLTPQGSSPQRVRSMAWNSNDPVAGATARMRVPPSTMAAAVAASKAAMEGARRSSMEAPKALPPLVTPSFTTRSGQPVPKEFLEESDTESGVVLDPHLVLGTDA